MTPTEHVTGTMRAVVAVGWRAWLYGVFAGALNGGFTSAIAVYADPHPEHNQRIAAVFLAGALLGAGLYIKQSPRPWDRKTERRGTGAR